MRELILILSFCLISPYIAKATSGMPPKITPETKKEKTSPSRPTSPRLSKEELKRKKLRELIERKKQSLNNTEWGIEITPAKGGKRSRDKVVFKEGKVSLHKLLKEGFSPTNYTLTIQEDGTLLWETMQTAKGGKIVFIRGEITSDIKAMRGMLSFPEEGGTEDYSFRSISKNVLSIE